MAKNKTPMTQALRSIKSLKIEHELYQYEYSEKGGTAQTAAELGVDEHKVIKTLVLQDENRKPLIMLMHGDMEVSLKNLARQAGAKKLEQCDQKTAMKHTGYQFGGTSPFGTRTKLNIYAEAGIFELDKIYINAGARGLIACMDSKALVQAFDIFKVNAAQR